MRSRLFVVLAIVAAVQATSHRKTLNKDKRQIPPGSNWNPQADVDFVLDSSDTVGPDNFGKMLQFIQNMINRWTIGPTGMQVGVVTYGGGYHNQITLNKFSSASQLNSAISTIPFSGGTADRGNAFQFASQSAFGAPGGGRSNVPHVIIHVSNGPSSNPTFTLQQVKHLTDQGVSIFNIGVGGGIGSSQLNQEASNPSSRYVVTADNYNSLNDLAIPLAARIKNEVPTTVQGLPAPTGCPNKADIVFLLDSSTSVGQGNYEHLEDFLKHIVSRLPVGPDLVHVGMMQFSSHPSQEFPLDMYSDRMSVLKAIDDLKYMGGGTNTADALKYMREQMFSQNAGARSQVPRIAIVITDGESSNTVMTTQEADKARMDNIGIIAVGVGSGANSSELHSIASDPDSTNMFSIGTFSDLKTLTSQIINAACNVHSMAPPVTTRAPGATNAPENCTDLLDNCATYGTAVCKDYKPWAQDKCRKFCGFCTPLHTAPPPPCVDKQANCDRYGDDVCNAFGPWAHENCMRFCGFCDPNKSSTGYYGQCYYGGKTYSHGEKWEDGCDYQCICEDGNTGRYRCFNKCPLYHDLPADCTLVHSPGECCLKPVCNFKQQLQITEGSGEGKTSTGISVCMYNGKQYYQDQSWEVDCDYKCRCIDAQHGTYQCQAYCPTYTNLPSNCHLQKTPGKCCAEPHCEFNQQTGSFIGRGSTSGIGSVRHPTAAPPCENALPNCELFGKNSCIGPYVGWAKTNCRKFCDYCVTGNPTPSPTDKCYFGGKAYNQSEKWSSGCDMQCVCENAIYGYYRCTNTCPIYNNLPERCKTQKKAGECCQHVTCLSGSFLSSTTNLNSIGNGGGISVTGAGGNPINVQPTRPSGGTMAPGTGGTGMVAPQLKGCLYRGQVYVMGQRWDDGCVKTCQCINEENGLYQCRDRCPHYINKPAVCTEMRPDPNDACCKVPHCSGYVPIPVYNQQSQSIGAVKPPSITDLITGVFTVDYTIKFNGGAVDKPTTPGSQSTGGIGFCSYKNHHYPHAAQWQDGCSYNCVCENAATGFWRCVDRCKKFENLPKPYCWLITDPNDSCCKVPFCDFTGNKTQITGKGSTPLPVQPVKSTVQSTLPTTPKIAVCIYKNKSYSKGQMWYDGCSLKCTCDNPERGFFRCTNRCPQYNSIPKDYCHWVQDPQDPNCCRIPKCDLTPTAGSITGHGNPQTVPPGSFSGSGQNPGGSTKIGYCSYKNKHYNQSQTWQDGCQYNCKCDDADSGLYTCTDMCPRYASLPPQCHFVTDFSNPCCKKPDCSFGYNSGQITGSGGMLTPAPGTLPPGQIPRPLPTCVYGGVSYYQGQTWQDGCNLNCRCEDANSGLYVCDDRCPKFGSLPSSCHMVTDPSDLCCQKPHCQFIPTAGQIHGSAVPSIPPTLVPGQIVGEIPTPTPGIDGKIPTRLPISVCTYKSITYNQGQKWQDGCDYDCQCVDATNGKYICTERCPQFAAMPPQCHLIKDASNPCCKTPVCDFTSSSGQNTGHANLTPSPGPGMNTPTPGPKPSFCVYKGVNYAQGQQWFDGCEYNCNCEDSLKGVYRCTNRCPSYPPLPNGCHLVSDPVDPLCCKRPDCHFYSTGGQQTGFLLPSVPPGVVTGGSVVPTPNPLLTPSPAPGVHPTPPYRDVCLYKGNEYTQGQRWQDGCDYNCECEDAHQGQYKCTETCAKYANIPPECYMVPDVMNPCCHKPYCDFSATHGQHTGQGHLTPSPGPGVHPTQAPKPDVCMYNGVPFTKGATWNDGCDLKCVCDDAPQYRCNERCPTFDAAAMLGCTMVTDSRDTCCKIPSCPPSIHNTPAPSLAPGMTPPVNPDMKPTPLPYPIPTAIPGVIHGSVVNPNHNNPNTTSMCNFKHVVYHTGETWKDGCQYNCVCEDQTTGKYKCTERCPAYMNIPAYCTLVVDPNDFCCKVPSCSTPPGLHSTPGTGNTPLPMSTLYPPTNKPGVSPTPAGISVPTPQPQASCYYKNVRYVQGQQWYDGCDKVCVCEDGKTNFYRCSDRCTSYDKVPSQCRMVADPMDPQCCQIPECTPTPGPNGYPTPQPGISAVPTIVTNVPGFITGLAPTPTPGVSGKTPAPRFACVYKGTEYRQGQKWQDGCHYNCVCENEVTGKYRCDERCSTYPFVPLQCKLERDRKDVCCFNMVCDFQKPTPNPYAVPTPGPNQSPGPVVQPTLGPGQTPNPNATPVPTKGHIIPPNLSFCVYKGVPYRQGQEWTEGCQQKCRCDDASSDTYNCYDRCPSYNNLPSSCTMVADPSDPCCQIPQCIKVPTPVPGITPNPVPGQKPTPVPSPIPTAVPGIINGHSPNHNPVDKLGSCVYKGVKYTHGQTWQDGCLFNCVCLDDSTGQYQCTERCPKYPNIPNYCFMVTDPNDACCQTPQCPGLIPTLKPVITPSPGPNATPGQVGTTLVPPVLTTSKPVPKEICIYKGHAYSEHQFWYDGCEKRCVCEDGKTGFYRCTDRCPQYPNIAPNCIMVVDPNDPMCCKAPQCNHGNSTAIPTGVVGVVTGGGKPPTGVPTPGPDATTMFPPLFTLTPTPGPGVSPKAREVCVYKNHEYRQGQKWVDGCDYTCVCTDGVTGQYRCTERCPHFPNMPYYCRMVFDPSNPCCQKPDCNQPTPVPGMNPTLNASLVPVGHPTQSPTLDFCVYNGIPFHQGQSWNDGCDKVCRCEDAITGHINCDDRCPKFTNIPPGCTLVTDTKDQCCQVPSCTSANTNNPNTYLNGVYGKISGSSLPPNNQNPLPKKDECVYHGKSYKKGDNWDDGCSYTCECLDDHTGSYTCTEMCPRYPLLPSQCTMVKDPQNKCCQTPSCPNINPTPYPIGYIPYPGASPYPGPSKYPIGYTPSPGATPYLGPTPYPIGYIPYPGATPYPGPSKYPIGYTPSPGATPYLGPTPYPIGYVPYPGMTPYPGPSRYPIGFTPSPGATPYLGPTPWPIGYTPYPRATPYPGPSKYPVGFTPFPGATPYLGPTPWPIGYTPSPGATPYPGPSKYPIGFTPSPGATPYLGPTPYPIGFTPWYGATPYPGPSKYPIGFTPSPGATPYLGPTPWPIGYTPYPRATPYPGPSKYPIGFTPFPGATPYLGPTPWPIGYTPSPGATPYPGPSKYPIGFTPSPGATPYLGPTPYPIGFTPWYGATPYPGPSKYPIGFTPSPGATPYLGPTPWPIGYTLYPGATPYPGPSKYPIGFTPSPGATPYLGPTPWPIGYTLYPGATPYPGPSKYPVGVTPSPGATPYLGPTPWPIGYVPYPGATPYPGPSKYPVGFTPSPGATPYLGPTPYPIGYTPYPGATPYPGPSKYPIGFTPSPGATPYLGPTPWPIGYTPSPGATPYPGPSKYPIGFTPSPGATPYLGPTPWPIGYTPYPGATPYPGPSKYPIGFTPSPGATPYLGPTPWPIGYTPSPGATPYPGPSKYPIGFTPSPGATPYLGPTPYPIGFVPSPGATPYPGPSKFPIGFTPSPGATPYLGPTPWPIGYTPSPGATPYAGPSKYPIGFTPSPGATPYLGPTPWPIGYTPSPGATPYAGPKPQPKTPTPYPIGYIPYPGATPYPGPAKYPIGFTPSPGATPYLGPTPYPIGYTPYPGATPYPGPSKYPIGFTPSPGATPYLGPTPYPIGYTPYPRATPYPGPSKYPIGFTPSPGATPYLGPTPYPIGYTPYPGATPYPGPSKYPIGFTPSPGATPYLGPTPYPIGYTPYPRATPYPGPSKYPIGFTPSPGATPYLGPTPYPIGYTPYPGATPYPGPSKYPIGFTPSPGATPYLGPTPYPIGYTPYPRATPYPGPSKYPIGFTPSPGATPYLGPTPYPIGYTPNPGATPYPGPSKYPIGFTPSPGATPYLGPTPYPIGYTPYPRATPYPGPSKYPIGFTPSPGATPYLGPTPYPIGYTPYPGATPYPGPSKYPIGFTPSPGATPYLGPTPWPVGYVPHPGATPYPGPSKYPIGYTPSPGATPYLGPTPWPIGYTPSAGATPYPGPSKYPIGFTPNLGATPYLGPTPWPIGSIPYPGGTPYPGPSKYPIGFTPSPGATPYLGPTPWPIGYTPNPFATPYPGPSKYPIGFTPYPNATPYLGPTPYPIGYTPWPNATPYPGPSKYPIGFTPSPGATPYLGPTPYPIGYVPYPGITPYPGPSKYPIGYTPSPGATPYLGPTPWPIGYTPSPGATPYPGPSKYPIGFTPFPGATPYLGPTPWPIGHVPYPGATPYPGPSKYPIGFTPSPGATPYLGPTPWPIGYTPSPGATPYPGPFKYPFGFTPFPGATAYLGPTPWPIGFTPSPGATPYPGPSRYPIGYTPSPGATPYLGPTPWPVGYTPFPGASPYPGPHVLPQNTPTPAPDTKVCKYKDQYYRQDQQWYDGCHAICKCEDADQGLYRCQERCAHFTNTPAECMMVPDPRDPSCCQMPECPFPTPAPGVTPTPGYMSITPVPGIITGIGKVPTPSPLKPTTYGCLYKGKVYGKSQTWADGCDYDCECLDDMTGQYKCSEKCPRIPNLPKQCVLLRDPKKPCCETPYCDFQHPTPFPGGIPTPDPSLFPSVAPGFQTPPPNPSHNPGFCVYKGVYYKQGQTWSEGCKLSCVCDDSSTGQYTCKERCPTFPNLPPTCIMQTDPSDRCCVVPNCNNLPHQVVTPKVPPGINSTNISQKPVTAYGTYTGTPTPATTLAPVLLPTGVPGSFQGSSGSGNHPMGTSNGGTSGFGGVCVYKSVAYKQNEKWSDGCDYNCECLDAVRGLYQCTDKCPKYYFVPPQCKMVQDPHNTCCKVAECDPRIFTPTPNPFPVTPATVVGHGGSGSPQVPVTHFGEHTGTPPLHINGSEKTGPQGSGLTLTPVTHFGEHTGTPPLHINGSQQTGPQGSGLTLTPVTHFGEHTGTPPLHITGSEKTGPQGSGLTLTPVTHFGEHTGTPPLHINGSEKTGPQGSGLTVTPVTHFGEHTGTPPLHINGSEQTGPQGSGLTVTPVTHFGEHTGTPVATTEKPPNYCMYTDGKLYLQGQTWNDGCQYLCNCLDPKTNNFRCDLRCPSYSGLPNFCTMKPDPLDPCCKKPSCTYNGHSLTPLPGDKFHPPVNPTLSPGVTNVIPLGTHSVFSGSSYPPGSTTTGSAGGHTVCVYKNIVHRQGESWDDGCKYTCTCIPGRNGVYRCISKCPTYPAIPQYCTFTDIPGQCCPTLSCNIPGVGNYHPVPQINPHPIPTLAPGQSPTAGPTQDPQIIVGSGPGVNFGGSSPGGGALVPTISSTGGFVSGFNDKCIYKGRMYNQGETWSDGCQYDCECKDGHSGFFQCKPKCATYQKDQIPPQCYFVKSPGQCCETPVCQNPDGSTVNPQLHPGVYPLFGSYSGGFTGFRPGYQPNYIPTSSGNIGGRLEGCVYKGTVYNKGDHWSDGCLYDCECLDNQLGQYRCMPKCPSYTALPPICHLVAPPSGQCCQQVSCVVSTVVPTTPAQITPSGFCIDKLDNCRDYGVSSCRPPYVGWAKSNCPAFCQFCNPSIQTTAVPCIDKLPNCKAYGKTSCVGIYAPWAGDNCRKFCDLCHTTPSSFTTTELVTKQCVDKLSNCKDYGDHVCKGQYTAWARDNCAQFCGYCGTTAPPHAVNVVPDHGWTLLLKGVAGVPGNLAAIWNSATTLNEHVPSAQYLTNQYKGHYKPDLSNHWNECNFKQIKVAIFNQGVEKANIIFDAVGATKNNWFSRSRIISSTWNDIKTAPTGIFSILGDQLFGREFYASSHSSGCSTLGWMMVSTKSGCAWETTNGQGPSFFYAPGQNMVNFDRTRPGSGDVFAIMAQGGTCGDLHTTAETVTGFVGTSGGVCFYKNKLYKQGESWTDGCDYNCTCENGKAGFYKCKDLCPTYSNLPQQCTLVKKPGECCSEPSCPWGHTVDNNFCFYKGQNYVQGAKWDDGCDYKCTCVDASKGFYQCSTKCLQWTLPKTCIMKPPPQGKCCPVPSCPPNIVINYVPE